MSDDLDTDKGAAQGEDQDLEKKQDPPEGQDKGKNEKPFTPEQEQYIGSWMGRIIKKQFEDNVIPLMEEKFPAKPTFQQHGNQDDALRKLNEELSEELLINPLGAFQKMLNAVETTRKTLTKNQQVQVDKAITSYSDDPLYKDIYPEMKEIARQAVGDGYPPEAAARFAKAQAEANFYKKKNSSEGGLDLADGGKTTTRKKEPKLPDKFKKAFERDKAKGLFKTEAEYIESLSPAIREKYGI